MGENEEGAIEPSEVNLKEVTFLEMGKFPDRAAKQGAGYRVIEGQDLTEFQVFKRDGSAQYTVIIDVTDAKVCKAKVFCSCPQWVQRGFHEAEACKHLHMVFWAAIAKRGIIKQVVEVVPYKLTQDASKLGKHFRDSAKQHQMAFHEAKKEESPVRFPTAAEREKLRQQGEQELEDAKVLCDQMQEQVQTLAVVERPELPTLPDRRMAVAWIEELHKLKAEIVPQNENYITIIDKKPHYRLAAVQIIKRACNISTELVREEEYTDSKGRKGWKCVVRATDPLGVYNDGDGACCHDEPRMPPNVPDHFVRAKAASRAEKRAVNGLLGGGVPPAEED